MSNSFSYATERRTMDKLRFSIHLTSTEIHPFYNVYKFLNKFNDTYVENFIYMF